MANQTPRQVDDKLKEGLVMVLKCVSAISKALTVVNPIFGLTGAIIAAGLADDSIISTLKSGFGELNLALDKLDQLNKNNISQIKLKTLDSQLSTLENNLEEQFRSYMEMLNATPANRKSKTKDFKRCYKNTGHDDNLQSLYDNVVGIPRFFSSPILKVYVEERVPQALMERLCTRLKILFCIGLFARMSYAAIKGDDDTQDLMVKWSKNMEDVSVVFERAIHGQKGLEIKKQVKTTTKPLKKKRF